ncbi:MAG: formate dehydrogenase accessory sulfurtransferase FdhD [Saprospiraceae bacterium]|nr:formate dehydrogenase accessory sulfurtransferase FdhD [Saprospiraceae bacterium]
MKSRENHRIKKYDDGRFTEIPDPVSVEAPLQISLRHGKFGQRSTVKLAMTMRTPGQDDLLASGYLFTENLIQHRNDIVQMRHLSDYEILVELSENVTVDLTSQARNTYVNSSCGICGKSELTEINATIPYLLTPGLPQITSAEVCQWPGLLDEAQLEFRETGGTHAAALIRKHAVINVQEDVGRHNALDKLLGFALQNLSLPLSDTAVVVSSRASFELVQKALMAGIPILASFGAASSMAIETALDNNMTLIGFLKQAQFNVYTHGQRVTIQHDKG